MHVRFPEHIKVRGPFQLMTLWFWAHSNAAICFFAVCFKNGRWRRLAPPLFPCSNWLKNWKNKKHKYRSQWLMARWFVFEEEEREEEEEDGRFLSKLHIMPLWQRRQKTWDCVRMKDWAGGENPSLTSSLSSGRGATASVSSWPISFQRPAAVKRLSEGAKWHSCASSQKHAGGGVEGGEQKLSDWGFKSLTYN